MASPLYVTEAEVERALQAGPLTDALEQVFLQLAQGQASQRPRDRVVLGKHVQHTLASISLAWGMSAVKTYVSGPAGVRFVTLLFSLEENRLLATIESERLGQLRTGCATALAVRRLTQGSQRLALFGTGTVAQGQLEALVQELGERLHSVRVFGRSAQRLQEFCERMSSLLELPVEGAGSPEICLEKANLVVTATTSSQPVFAASQLASSGVLCAVGGNWARKREIDEATVDKCAQIWVDDMDQARVEAGELISVPAAWERCRPFAELVAGGARKGDASENTPGGQGWTLFKSLGVGLEDLAAARLVYQTLQ